MNVPHRALVRPPADSYSNALTREADPRPVDLALAQRRHAAYTNKLQRSCYIDLMESKDAYR